ncbi:MAG: fumarylacetoacetate hydrolase family protein [Steroidobacteraceae bacterium]|nr:fumarylacetoacetate hydrolase family protein [Steroidobacteraceae bacterium]
MKLASLKGGRDGRLVVVSRDLQRMLPAGAVAATLQAALDRWDECRPALEALAHRLEAGEGERFDEAACAAPLPRAFQWADGSAYVNHVALVRRARGAELPPSFWTDPLMYQGGSDSLLGPRDPILMDDEAWGIDFEAEVAVITGDVPQGADATRAAREIRLLMLVNDVSLRELIPGELAKGFGFFQSKPSSAFSPVAVTPDELGNAWDGGRLRGALEVQRNGELFGRADAAVDMTFPFPALLAHAARTRPLAAGTIIGSGTVSNRDADGGPGRPVAEGGLGYSCIAEQRTVETLRHGAPRTSFLRFGETVRIEMRDAAGLSMFGAIEQQVRRRAG